jgi:Flp pilus assembly protein TadB
MRAARRIRGLALRIDRERAMMQVMPLSEDEQRILRQIEQELEQDPSFSERGYRVSRRRLLLLLVGLVAGLVLTVAGLAVSFWLAFVAFLAVLALAVLLESEVRVVGREKLGNLPINAWLAGSGRQQRKPE